MNQIELMTKLYNSPTFVKQTLSKINITKTNNYEIPSAALSTNIGKIDILIAWVDLITWHKKYITNIQVLVKEYEAILRLLSKTPSSPAFCQVCPLLIKASPILQRHSTQFIHVGGNSNATWTACLLFIIFFTLNKKYMSKIYMYVKSLIAQHL